MTVDTLVKELELLALIPEGGYYKETYRSEGKITQVCLSSDFRGERNMATGIYFLIEKEIFQLYIKLKATKLGIFIMEML
jgi:predicted cupin superfamily sugar epimerase